MTKDLAIAVSNALAAKEPKDFKEKLAVLKVKAKNEIQSALKKNDISALEDAIKSILPLKNKDTKVFIENMRNIVQDLKIQVSKAPDLSMAELHARASEEGNLLDNWDKVVSILKLKTFK